MAKVPEELSRQREREAARLRWQGWTQQRIADQLGVTQQAVDVMLQRIERRLAEEFKEQAAEIKARQTAQLEQVVDETLTQWRRSYEDAVTEVTVKGKTEGGKADSMKAQVTRTVVGQSGNPGLIGQARGAMADIREIWGLNAPKRNEHSGPDGGPIEFSSGAAAFDHRVTQALEREDEGEDPGEPLG